MLSWWICELELQSARNAVEAWLVVGQPVAFYRTSMVFMCTGEYRVLCRLSQTCRMWLAFRHMGCMRCDLMHKQCKRESRCIPGSWEFFWEHEGHLRQRASLCWPCSARSRWLRGLRRWIGIKAPFGSGVAPQIESRPSISAGSISTRLPFR